MRVFIVVCCLLTVLSGVANAQNAVGFSAWAERTLWPRARAQGVSQETFQNIIQRIELDPSIPGLTPPAGTAAQSQSEFRHPQAYFRASGLRNNTQIGASLARTHAATLDAVESATGVPGHIILAIWGRESSFGRASVPHDAFNILATRAYLGRRSEYFTDELVAAMQIVEAGYATRNQMRGSWAGALGQPQFMPSNFLQYAADGNGDGLRDIWSSETDTLASIGVYLQAHGWRANRDWGFEVTVPSDVSCTLEGPDQGRKISDWEGIGVARVNGRSFPAAEHAETGYLLMPAGRDGPAFLVTDNFYVLKQYNESDAYALYVGHVGDRIAYGSSEFRNPWGQGEQIPAANVLAMQNALVAAGHDVGGADGLVGFKTRRSIGAWQEAIGRAATCYPSNATISAILR